MLKKIIKLIKKVNKSTDIINNIDTLLDYKIRSHHLLNSAITSTELITEPLKEGETELIVSFTSYSVRIHDVHLVVESIAQQSLKPNRLLLWLDENEFTLDSIPLILHRQMERGLEVRFCPNYRSYKKLIPTLKEFPDANVITIDDDFFYPHDMIEALSKEHALYPEYIIGHRAHKIKKEISGELLPYTKWEFETIESKASAFIFLTSGAGTFFPKHCFSKEVFNSDSFLSLCPNADDVWFKAMSLYSNIKCKKVNDTRDFGQRFILIPTNQDIGLFNSNVTESFNDKQLKSVFDKYDLYLKVNDE